MAPSDAPAPAASSPPSPPTPRRRFPYVRARWIILGVVALLLVWGFLAYRALDEARTAALAGVDRLAAAKHALTPEQLLEGKGTDQLAAAQREFDRAHDAISSPLLGPVSVLPVIGRQIDSVDALTSSASKVVRTGRAAAADARRTIKGATGGGQARLDAVASVQSIAETAAAELRDIDLGPGEALLPQLARARTRFVGDLGSLRRGLEDLGAAAAGMHAFLSGPTNYVVLAANNAEMRAGSGMWLSAGALTASGGSMELHDMQATADLRMPNADVPIDNADLDARWGWTFPNVEWRNLAMSPAFPANAQLAARMWEARAGAPVQGVLVIDAVALRALLQVTGPVEVDGRQITADNVVNEILLRQYESLDATSSNEGERRQYQSEIARAVIKALDAGGWDAAKLVTNLRGAVEARHILIWSSDATQQKGWVAAGVDGVLPRDGMMVSSLSQGGNKLDQFIRTTAALSATASASSTSVTLTVTMENRTPEGLPAYVAGPTTVPDEPGRGVQEGVYAGILAVDVPAAARGSTIDDGAAPLIAAGANGTTRVVATRFQLARGEQRTFTVTFELPVGTPRVTVVPSARVPPEHWSAAGERWTDDVSHVVMLPPAP